MKSVLLDTNLLLLFLVGNIAPEKVGVHRRLRKFDLEILAKLNGQVEKFQRHVSLPNVLSETSNFIRPGKQEITMGAGGCFANYCNLVEEIYCESRDAVTTSAYARLGLTDAAIIEVGKKGVTIITDDHALFGALHKDGVEAVNIHHLYNLD